MAKWKCEETGTTWETVQAEDADPSCSACAASGTCARKVVAPPADAPASPAPSNATGATTNG